MVQHIVSIVAGLAITLWATVLHQYQEFRGPVPENPAYELTVGPTILPAPSIQTPLDEVVEQIVQAATSTPVAPLPTPEANPKPLPTTTPTIPFTPLPLPTPPPITPPVTTPTPAPVTPSVVPNVDEKTATETLLKNSIVNIICLPGGGLRGASGSGVVVDPRGVIITVAHVAQNFLLTDYPEDNAGRCYIRTGSPAKNAYSAELIYISSDWIKENPDTFLTSRPRGTGQDDFAFLAITGSLTGGSVSNLSYIPMASSGTDIDEGDQVGIGSYAAEFLTSSQVRSSLYPTISSGPVNDVYTFGDNTFDIFSVRAGSAAQEGSSGGAVINDNRRLIGLITTRTVKADLSLRDLQALTMDHIRRSFRADMKTDLDSYLRGNLSTLVSNYADDAAELLDILEESIAEAN
jgi:hypothetical protein